MNIPAALPRHASRSTYPVIKSPSAALFDYVNRRFGRSCFKINVKRNSSICCQGMHISSLYMVHEGEILLSRVTSDGRDTLLSILGPGDFFGESALINGSAVAFSATTSKRAVVSQLPERMFKTLLEDSSMYRYVLESIAQRCDDAWTQMEVIGCAHVRDKVRSGLAWLAGRIGVKTDKGIRIDMNQARMACMIGCARETLNREISRLKKTGAVDTCYDDGRKSFYIVDMEKLSG